MDGPIRTARPLLLRVSPPKLQDHAAAVAATDAAYQKRHDQRRQAGRGAEGGPSLLETLAEAAAECSKEIACPAHDGDGGNKNTWASGVRFPMMAESEHPGTAGTTGGAAAPILPITFEPDSGKLDEAERELHAILEQNVELARSFGLL